jgi:hypothetical protein
MWRTGLDASAFERLGMVLMAALGFGLVGGSELLCRGIWRFGLVW